MERIYDQTKVRLMVTTHPVLDEKETLLQEDILQFYGLSDIEQKQLIQDVKRILRENDINWFHLDENVREAHVGAEGIGSDIVVWLTHNYENIASGLIGTLIYEGAKNGYKSVFRGKTTINYFDKAEDYRKKIETQNGDTSIKISDIKKIKDYVLYKLEGDKYSYVIEEFPDGNFSVQRQEKITLE